MPRPRCGLLLAALLVGSIVSTGPAAGTDDAAPTAREASGPDTPAAQARALRDLLARTRAALERPVDVGVDGISVSTASSTLHYPYDADTATVGAASTQAGASAAQWGPAGDAVAVLTGPVVTITNDGGAPSGTYHRPTGASVPTWLATGDGFIQQVYGDSDGSATAQSTNPSWRQEVKSGRASYGQYAVSPYGTEAVVRSTVTTRSNLLLVSVRSPMSLAGQPERFPAKDYYVSSYRPGNPAVTQEPGKGIVDPSARTYIAFLGVEPGTHTGWLFVDYQDGRHLDDALQPTAVVATGSPCVIAAPAFSPDRKAVAYLQAAGPVSSPCSKTQLRLVRLGANGLYDGSTAKVLATSAEGAPFLTVSWKARTAPARQIRIGGVDRYDVAVNVATSFFPDASANGAVVAGGEAYADALAGGPLAAQLHSPVMLTRSTRVDAPTLRELDRILRPGAPIYVLGGVASVSAAAVAQLRALGHPVARLGGPDRFAVAVSVARQLDRARGHESAAVFVANGRTYPDALVAGPAASLTMGAILLSDGDRMPAATRAYLNEVRPAAVYGIGGGGSASLAGDPGAIAVTAPNRYALARAVADRFFTGEWVATIVSGSVWADATVGGAVMGQWKQPILFADGQTLPRDTVARLAQSRAATDAVLAFGGASSVDQRALDMAALLAGTQTVYRGPDMPH